LAPSSKNSSIGLPAAATASGEGLLSLRDYRQIENLELLAKQVVEGFLIGLHKSPFHGFSVEFAEHRVYNPGQPMRHVDWKVFARTDRLYTKRYEEETNLRCQLVLDASSSMFFPEGDILERRGGVNKARFSAVGAAALMHLMRKQRDAAGLSIFGEELDVHTKARSSGLHQRVLLGHIDAYLQGQARERPTRAAECLHQIADSIPRRSLVVIFSDLFDRIEDPGALFSALQHLRHAKHEVVFFHVTDAALEMEFQFDNRPYRFIDLETGEQIKLRGNEVRERYVERMTEFRKALKLRCGQYQIDYVEADAAQPFRQILLPYLMKRARMR
jgi:uncharacterized protein (DUF58 family)